MKREYFEQQLRDRLDGYEPQVTDDLWQQIDARLSSDERLQQTETVRPSQISTPGHANRHQKWWLLAAAAAVTALVVVLWPSGGVSSGGHPHPSTIAVNDTPSAPSHTRPYDGGRPTDTRLTDTRPSDGGSPSDIRPLTPPPGSPFWRGRATSNLEGERSHLSNSDTPNNNSSSGSSLVSPSDVASSGSPSKLEGGGGRVSPPNHVSQSESRSPSSHLSQLVPPSFGGATGEASFSLYAHQAFGSSGGASPFYLHQTHAGAYTAAFADPAGGQHGAPPVYQLAGYEEHTEHHRPVTAGLSVRWPITRRWGVQTGISYTWLSSDFIHTMRGVSITDRQSLQYVGIPVAATYDVWSKGRFRVYLMAGGAALFNTSARMTTDGVESHVGHDRVQWAINAAAGVQYRVVGQVSLYVEPGAAYYPDNGSDIDNFFKDKPVNPSLQFGLRWDFGR